MLDERNLLPSPMSTVGALPAAPISKNDMNPWRMPETQMDSGIKHIWYDSASGICPCTARVPIRGSLCGSRPCKAGGILLSVGFYVTQCHRQLWQEVTREQTRIAHALADEHPRTAVQVDACAGGVKGVHALRQEAPDNTGEYVARAGGGERGIPRPVRAQAAIRRGDQGGRALQHHTQIPRTRGLPHDLDTVWSAARNALAPAQTRHFARMRRDHGMGRQPLPPAVEMRQIVEAVGIHEQPWPLGVIHRDNAFEKALEKCACSIRLPQTRTKHDGSVAGERTQN